jgi:hypothetical protein
LRILIRGHRDEAEAAGFAAEFVLDEFHALHRAGGAESRLQIGFRGVEREIAYVEFRAHGDISFQRIRIGTRNRAFPRAYYP